jgi:dTMP kinase
MKKNPYSGKFIVFEGLDGSGKSTQVDLLLKFFRENGKKVDSTAEPTQYLIGGLIKSWIGHDWQSSSDCLQLLFAADRAYHLEKEIIPLLKKGVTVICDRYLFSSLAYGSLDLDFDWLLKINQKFILPDITFFLDVSPKICLERMREERFSIELFEKEEKLKRVRENFLKLAKKFENFFIIDGERSVPKVFSQIKDIIFLQYGSNFKKSG